MEKNQTQYVQTIAAQIHMRNNRVLMQKWLTSVINRVYKW